MVVLANTISAQLPGQLPGYIQDNYPNFLALLNAYFKWMEDSSQNGTVYQIRTLLANKQIDTAADQFLQYFVKDFLPYFPQDHALDLRKLLKAATKFYQTKGSQNSIQFLLHVLYGLDSEIYYPKQNIIRLSDGRWQLPQSIKLNISPQNRNFNIGLLIGRRGVGVNSNTTCVIESLNLAIDPTLNREILELYLSSISDAFFSGEPIQISCGNDVFGNPLVFQEKIIGSLSGIIIDPNNPGLKYVGTQFYSNGSISYPGDPVSIIGGLANANDIIQAIAYVGNVSQGSLQSISVLNGGYGYQLNPSTIVTIQNTAGDLTGQGGAAIVDVIDTANQVFLFLNTDSISFKQNVVIGSNNYQFSNTVNANLSTVLSNAFAYVNIAVAPIAHMNVTSIGSGYTQIPTINLRSVFETDLSTSLLQAYNSNPTPNNLATYLAAKGNVQDLGRIAAVRVLAGGQNYSNTKDKLTVDSSVGYGASFDFITDINGTVQQVLVLNSGAGYAKPKPPLFMANSANLQVSANGTGAIFQAFGDNDGESLQLSVSDIGRIRDIRITNRGFDYLTTPMVSLRVQDVTINPISNNQFYVQGETIFQGANANAASFIANIDNYDRANGILRLYNYVGTINTLAVLVGANQNATPISTKIYGNGKAKANAQFFGGLIKYPGFWLTTDSFLSADQSFQDADKFHNYSYLVKVEKSLAAYQDSILKIAHPAGMKLSGIQTVTDRTILISRNSEAEPIQMANSSNTPGKITTNAFSSNAIVTGFSNTTFLTSANVGDLLLISFNNSRLQVKTIMSIANNASLNLDSNTVYFAPDQLLVTNGSNLIISTAATSNLVANDIIQTNIAGNAQTSLVVSVGLGTANITVNTVFSVNATNVPYLVFPYMDNVAYSFYRPT